MITNVLFMKIMLCTCVCNAVDLGRQMVVQNRYGRQSRARSGDWGGLPVSVKYRTIWYSLCLKPHFS